MIKSVLLDLDGVLADFVGAAAAVHNKEEFLVTHWGIEECWQMSGNELWAPFAYDFWANLPRTAEAFHVVEMCEKAAGIGNVGVLTSPCRTEGCTDGKLKWLRKHFPHLERECLVGKAKHRCAHPNALLVDDSDDNVESFREYGGHACLFPRPWNKNRAKAADPLSVLRESLDAFMRG